MHLAALRYAAADKKYLAAAYINLTSDLSWNDKCLHETITETAAIINNAVAQADAVRKQKKSTSPIRWLNTEQQQRVYAELSNWRVNVWNKLKNNAQCTKADRRWIGNVMRNHDMHALSLCKQDESERTIKMRIFTWTELVRDSTNWSAVLKIIRAG